MQKSKHLSYFLFFLVFLGLACEQSKPTKPQYFLKMGKETVFVEIADTQEKQTTGLMHRQSLEENQGMLFAYPKPKHLSFWMKNTHIPLSIAFLDENGIITEIVEMAPYDGRPDSLLPNYTSKQLVRYALEMYQGWFQKKNIAVGERVVFSPSLKEYTTSFEAKK